MEVVILSLKVGKMVHAFIAGPRGYTKAEVASHNSDKSCWVIIANKVYDVTKFLDDHPVRRLFPHDVGVFAWICWTSIGQHCRPSHVFSPTCWKCKGLFFVHHSNSADVQTRCVITNFATAHIFHYDVLRS